MVRGEWRGACGGRRLVWGGVLLSPSSLLPLRLHLPPSCSPSPSPLPFSLFPHLPQTPREASGRSRARQRRLPWLGAQAVGPLAPVPGARQGLRWACPRSATRHLDGPEALPLSASSSPNFRAPRAPQVSTSLCPSYPASQVPLLGPRAVLPSPRLLFAGRAPDPVS